MATMKPIFACRPVPRSKLDTQPLMPRRRKPRCLRR